MDAVIASFRRGRRTQTPNQVILHTGSSVDEATKLVGKKVVYKTSGNKEIKGEVKAIHGKNGQIRATFEKGMPGQSLGQKVSIQ